jgi:hypothetical protein
MTNTDSPTSSAGSRAEADVRAKLGDHLYLIGPKPSYRPQRGALRPPTLEGFLPAGIGGFFPLRHREWGLYEVGICGHDGMLVRIGWPSQLIKGE